MHKVQHITAKELDILKYFYDQRRGHVRQIKKAVKLSEHTLLKYLGSLEKRKIVASRKEGNLKIYEVNLQSDFVKIFFSYFDLQRLEMLEYKRGKAVKLFSQSLKKLKQPYFLLLFGSTAKGNYTPKSDIDIIVVFEVVNSTVTSQIENIKKKVLAETGLKINAIIMTLEEFMTEKENKENYALQDALQSGYPIFGNQSYYEVVFK